MPTKRKEPSRLTKALLEMADDARCAGVMDNMTHAKITLRHLGDKANAVTEPISGEDIRKLREDARMSQPVFARSQPHGRVRLAVGAGCEAADRPGARFAQRHTAPGHRGDFISGERYII
jgi:hypothetical protein